MARFFGGQSDGAEFSVARKQQRVVVPFSNRRNLFAAFSLDDPIMEGPVKTEEYRLERIAGEKQVFEVYVHTEMSVDIMLHRLIEHYRTIPSQRQIAEREAFEAMIVRKNLPRTRLRNSDGSEGEYRHCAVQLAWEAWLECAGYGQP